jgi:hypothetical protein
MGGGERDVTMEPELGRKGHAPPTPPGYVQTAAGVEGAEVKTARPVEGQRRDRDSKRASLKREMARDGDGDGDERGGDGAAVKKGVVVKKGRMRSRLSKWIHKLGSSSSSSPR